jgi:tRNA threonylcarbamoyl adenosine modification protein YjeE
MRAQINSLEDLNSFARGFLDQYTKGAIVGLTGTLGAGKTTFVRACVQHLAGSAIRVASPTFVLHQSYPQLEPPVDHFDLYRLQKPDRAALLEAGYLEAVAKAKTRNGLVFIEWPELAACRADLQLTVSFTFEIQADGGRLITASTP